MGKVALAAKITHVPSLYLSELPGPRHGCRQPAIDGHREIGRRCRELGVDTIVVFDTHWLVNAGYHINCAPHFEGLYTSNELPHFIANMEYGFPGNPELGRILAEGCNALGVETLAHDATTLGPEYGTLVPMRYMNQDRHFKVVSVSALCTVHYLNDSARLGWAMRKAVEEHYDGTVAFLASGSLSHRFAQNGQAPDFSDRIWSPFLEVLDHEVVQMWQEGRWAEFCGMLPEYASKGHGEGFMHDTAMLLGALGWSAYDGKAEVVTPYFGSSGTGQINAVFPVTAQDGSAIPPPRPATRPAPVAPAASEDATMPHFIAEYTDNIEAEADLPGLFEKVHACLGASGVFPLGGIRSRGVRLDTWRMADGRHDYAFVHMTLKVGAGRDLETRRQVAEALFEVITAHFAELQARRLLALSFELTELDAELNYKRNNVHEFLNNPAD